MSINAVHVTAARLRFRMNVNGYSGAAACDGGRSAAQFIIDLFPLILPLRQLP